jgi:hypothetical protein
MQDLQSDSCTSSTPKDGDSGPGHKNLSLLLQTGEFPNIGSHFKSKFSTSNLSNCTHTSANHTLIPNPL